MSIFVVIVLVVGVAVAVGVVTAFLVTRQLRNKLDYMIDAFEDRAVGFRYTDHTPVYFYFNKTLNRLCLIFERELQLLTEQNQYYGKMLEKISTGILVINTDLTSKTGDIIYTNRAAEHILGMPALSHIRQLSLISTELQGAFEQIKDNAELRCVYYNERNKITISLTATEADWAGRSVKIVAFNNITSELEHSEEQSWYKLVRVLNHEIMNTITPIASLSSAFYDDLKQARKDHGATLNLQELEQGFETIASSSQGLIKFVNNYRNLTRIAAPIKKAFFLRELIENVCHLTEEEVETAGAKLEFIETTKDILLYADQNQIAQIIINLIKNALQAEARKIAIETRINFEEQVEILVSNNGRPISQASSDQIFIPFYTTKPDGSGIGLSLSRQIMRQHNGSINLLRSTERITTFSLLFR